MKINFLKMSDKNSTPKKDDLQKIVVNSSCIGCGICVAIAPEIFEMSLESGKSKVKKDIDLSNLEKAREAAEACPVGAIEVAE